MRKTLTTEVINRYFYGYVVKSHEYTELTQNANDAYGNTIQVENLIGVVVREAFHAGARWQLRESAKLSPYISKFLEMCILLGPDDPRDVWLESTDVLPNDTDVDMPEHEHDWALKGGIPQFCRICAAKPDDDPVASAYPVERDLDDIPF